MFTIYFDIRKLIICENSSNILDNPNCILYSYSESSDLKGVPMLMRNNQFLDTLCIATNNGREQMVYKNICSEFTQINAGGGLVENDRGEYLLIFRNGYWDLPKGKQEPDEDIRNTALREVEEECGLHDLELRELICVTDHTYMLNDNHILKHTYWYKMLYKGDEAAKPQTEEDITECIWVKPRDIYKYMDKTYPSIIDVMKNVKVCNAGL